MPKKWLHLQVWAGAFAASWVVRFWAGTLSFRYRPLGALVDPNRRGVTGRYIYAFWHEYLLLPVCFYARPDIHVLISRNADARLIAEICRHLSVRVILGSTSRGGAEAVRKLVSAGRSGHLALTPDGPRGPRRHVQQGVIYLAGRLGLPVVPVGLGLQRPWRTGSWDRFAVPRPFSRARCVTGEPITVPHDPSADCREQYRLLVEGELARVTEVAEEWAETGKWPHRVRGNFQSTP